MKQVKKFQVDVLKHWQKNGRHTLPWRLTNDPYRILVSEVMLQQTQVDRVIPYFEKFLKKFPTVQKLAKAKLGDVLKLWSGLGYNRRAKYLHDAGRAIVERHGGKFPRDYTELRKLPGVGDYTARAVRVFAFNEPDILIETNIRTVFFHHAEVFHVACGRKRHGTYADAEVLPMALEAAKEGTPAAGGTRVWHWALMDYGAYLKKSGVRLNDKSAHYAKQSKFEGSNRQLRGRLLRRLMDGPITKSAFKDISAKNVYDISMVLGDMEKEGLVIREKNTWRID
jgi:A/G-specific adenine glycosylase